MVAITPERMAQARALLAWSRSLNCNSQSQLQTRKETMNEDTLLVQRASRGEHALLAGFGHRWEEGDIETAAKDTISNILTRVFGPAGRWKMGRGIQPEELALDNARRLIDAALRSYAEDAEDYIIEPEPGEYGYEDDA
jgi:hypothetical protein